jgi:hypothetical protein
MVGLWLSLNVLSFNLSRFVSRVDFSFFSTDWTDLFATAKETVGQLVLQSLEKIRLDSKPRTHHHSDFVIQSWWWVLGSQAIESWRCKHENKNNHKKMVNHRYDSRLKEGKFLRESWVVNRQPSVGRREKRTQKGESWNLLFINVHFSNTTKDWRMAKRRSVSWSHFDSFFSSLTNW